MKSIAAVSGAALLGALAVGPALAGGYAAPVVEAPVAAPAPAVTQVGRDWTGGYAGVQLGWGDVSASGAAINGNGAFGGVNAGYDHDFGRWVLGGKLAYYASNTDLGGADKLKGMTRLGARVGADMGQWMPYLELGAARARADLGAVSRSDTGWYGGLGVDYALNDSWTVGGEVLSSHFGNFDNTGVDLKPTTVTVGAAFRF